MASMFVDRIDEELDCGEWSLLSLVFPSFSASSFYRIGSEGRASSRLKLACIVIWDPLKLLMIKNHGSIGLVVARRLWVVKIN